MVVLPPVNIFVVLLASISQMLLGMAWYSQTLFGKPWMKLMGFTQKEMQQDAASMKSTYTSMFVGIFLQASVLAVLLERLAISSFADAWILALLLWLGFVAVTQLSAALFAKQAFSFHLFTINTSYQLFGLVLMASIIQAF
ncbi:MAG: DUF1761 domain-containing protein [Patescibacteria group bacterium]